MDHLNNSINNAKAYVRTERAVKKESQEQIEETLVEEIKEDLRSNITEQTDPKMSALQALATFNQVFVSGAQPKTETKEVKGGRDLSQKGYDELVEDWYALDFETATYDVKLSLMEDIINAAIRTAAEYEEGSAEYQKWIDKANEWRCYRVTMICNYNQQTFNSYLVQVQNHVSLDNLEPEWIRGWEASLDYAYLGDEQHSIVYQDFIAFEREGHWGGEAVGMIFVPNPNTTQRFIYDSAMIAVYRAKHAAIGVLLNSDDISDNTKVLLRRTKIALEAQLQNLIRDRDNIAKEKGYMNSNGTFVGECTSTGSSPYGLIPGLFPPENATQPRNNMTPEEIYQSLQQTYETETDLNKKIALVRKLIWYAQQIGNTEDAAHWQEILDELTQGQNGSNGEDRGTASSTYKILSNTTITKEDSNNVQDTTPNSSNVNTDDTTPTDNIIETTIPEINLNSDFATLTAAWNDYVASLTTEPEAYEAKIALLNAIIDRAIAEGKDDKTIDIWRCRRFIMVQNYTAALLGNYNYQLKNSGNITYSQHPLENLGDKPLVINGFDFCVEGFPNPSVISYVNNSWHAFNSCCVDPSDYTAVEGFHGPINWHGAGYLPNEDPEKEFLYDRAMISYHRARIQAIQIRIYEVEHMDGYSTNTVQQNYVSNLRNWINTSYREIQRFQNIINNFGNIYGDEYTQEQLDAIINSLSGLTPAQPVASNEPPLTNADLVPPEGDPGLQEFYDNTLAKYQTLIEQGVDPSVTVDIVEQLLIAARRLGNTEAARRWQEILDGLTNNRGNSSTPTSAKALFGDGEKSGSTTYVNNNLRDLPEEIENTEVSEEETNEDEEDFIVLQEKYDLMYEQYREEQEELYQQDLLKILLNFVCRRIANSPENYTQFWLNKYKVLIAEWNSRGWETFQPEYGISKPW